MVESKRASSKVPFVCDGVSAVSDVSAVFDVSDVSAVFDVCPNGRGWRPTFESAGHLCISLIGQLCHDRPVCLTTLRYYICIMIIYNQL